jgi:hypothetical protein
VTFVEEGEGEAMPQSSGESAAFRRLLNRTLVLPLVLLSLLSAAFIAQILHLKS